MERVPGFKYSKHILWLGFETEFTLGDDTTLLVEFFLDLTNSLENFFLSSAGKEVLAIAGSAKGADTAIVLRASNTHTFFETRVLEIVCKPRE